jgi:hypothetical protein
MDAVNPAENAHQVSILFQPLKWHLHWRSFDAKNANKIGCTWLAQIGATTLSIMTFSMTTLIMTICITINKLPRVIRYAECHGLENLQEHCTHKHCHQ